MTFELGDVPILPLFLVTQQPHEALCENDGFHLYLRHPDMSFKNLNSSIASISTSHLSSSPTRGAWPLWCSTLIARTEQEPQCRIDQITTIPLF